MNRLLLMMMTLVARSRRLGRNDLSLFCLFMSWPVCLVHRHWNNRPAHEGHWFLFPVEDPRTGLLVTQDIQYFIFDMGNMLSVSLILLSFILLKKKTYEYTVSLVTVFVISLVDILHYWLFFKQNELIMFIESLMMIAAPIFVIIRNTTRWKKQ